MHFHVTTSNKALHVTNVVPEEYMCISSTLPCALSLVSAYLDLLIQVSARDKAYLPSGVGGTKEGRVSRVMQAVSRINVLDALEMKSQDLDAGSLLFSTTTRFH